MDVIELLDLIKRYEPEYFIDLQINNNKVVGFYKTMYVLDPSGIGEDRPYLFPTTFSFENGKVKTTMVFGSVREDFYIPKVEGTGFGTELITASVGFHHYKLLMAVQHDNGSHVFNGGVHVKAFMGIILDLAGLGFPFMRIADNESIHTDQTFFK